MQIMTQTARFLLVLIVLTMAACSNNDTAEPVLNDDQHEQLEQQLSRYHTTDSLKIAFDDYKRKGNVLGQIVALRQLGRLCRDHCQYDWAVTHHREALQMAEKANDAIEMMWAMNNLASDYRRLGALSEAMDYHQQAYNLSMKHAETEHHQVRRNTAVALNGMGSVFLLMGNLQMADTVFRQALAVEEALGNLQGQALDLGALGNIKEQQGKTDEAWTLYRKSLELNERGNLATGISQSYNNIGRLYEQSGQLDAALESYKKGYRTLVGNSDDWYRLETGCYIGRIFIKQGDIAQATDVLERIETTARRIESLEHQSKAKELYYELYAKTGDTKQALASYIMADHLRDSLMNISKVVQIQNAQLEMERQQRLDDKARAEASLAKERHSKRLTYIWAGLLLLVAVVGIGMLWYTLHTRTVRQQLFRHMQRVREKFFTNITHEFRTPLTVILGLGHQLEDQEVEDMGQVRSAAKMIVRQGNSLLSLINQLLDISKVRSAVGEAKWRRGNIVPFVGMIVENFQSYAASKRIELSYSHSLNTIETDFVPDYLLRIVTNLLSNAMKFTPTYGKVNLTLETTSSNRLKLQVFDTGCGIPSEELPHLFEAFYQGSARSGEDVGTGIGLSLVKLMTEAMNGTVSAESIKGEGATFTVVLPIVLDGNTAPLTAEESTPAMTELLQDAGLQEQPVEAAAKPEKSAGEPKYTVLVVEDNQDIAYYVGMHLSHYRLIYARSGAEALEKAQETMPDLVITDVMMPGEIDGLELCRRIRSSSLLNHVPIIIITAKTTEEDRIKGLRAGADVYLMKPFNSEELLVRVDKMLKHYGMLRQKFLQADGQPTAELSAEDRQFMNKLIDNVYLLMAQGHTDVEALASRMALSRSQLNRRVLALTGQNTSAYMMRLRLARAKRLLMANVQAPVGEVAVKCGFDDVAYFSRIFRQTFGMTPSQYRKQG